ncbi:NUDIX domain-containing protein [Saccharospirillum mangrovi]|uniref:NUDIX domain-containing protein n=1 Tax=Saccharospirillum mangrovi TaxID=2161747 RepID=UPI000D36366C|nr:NUDIX domain-containing protein [Saccharospirillum mangrovi]
MNRDTDRFQFRIDQHESLYHGFYKMDRLTLTHQTFNGGELTIQRELMDRHDAVCVLLVDLALNEVVLVEQFRVGAIKTPNPWLLEVVAGLIDKDETPDEVARREAIEEAGVELGRLHPISHYLPSPGGSNESVYLYVAEADASTAAGVHGLDDEGEDIRVHRVPFDDAFAACRDGRINNAAALIALQWLQLNLAWLRQHWSE